MGGKARGGLEGPSKTEDEVTLKVLLAAGTALLRPPAPLPVEPTELVRRLEASGSLVPERWQSSRSAWRGLSAIAEAVEDSSTPTIPPKSDDGHLDHDRPSVGKNHLDRAQAMLLVGERCLDLVVGLQGWLEKEFWPSRFNDGLESRDFLLGTADLRLVRLLLSHCIASYLLPLAVAYQRDLPHISEEQRCRLSSATQALLLLCRSRPPPQDDGPGPSSSSASSGSSSNGVSKRPFYPPTLITQIITTSHLAPILLSTILLAYTPTTPPPVHASLRATLLSTLSSLSPTQAMSALGAVMKLQIKLPKDRMKGKDAKGWTRDWPGYVMDVAGGMMSAQVRRPGGVRAVMENVLGEAANLNDRSAVDTQKLELIAEALSRTPKNVDPNQHTDQLLVTLLDLVDEKDNNSSPIPVLYVHAACYAIHYIWLSAPSIAVPLLTEELHKPLLLPATPIFTDSAKYTNSPNSISRSIRLMSRLLVHAPSSSAFAELIVGPVLVPLISLSGYLLRNDSEIRESAVSINKGKSAEPASGSSAGGELVDDVKGVLVTWAQAVDKDVGIKRLWSAISSRRQLRSSEQDTKEECHAWQGHGAAVRICRLSDLPKNEVENHRSLVSLLASDETGESEPRIYATDQIKAETLVHLMKAFERPDIVTDILLRCLDGWRSAATASGVSSPADKTMWYLQLALSMMESLDDTIMGEPTRMLDFVEGVLRDEVEGLPLEKGPVVEVIQEGQEAGAFTGDSEILETALGLLGGVLEANPALSTSNTPILLPISHHLTILSTKTSSENVQTLIRETQHVLDLRKSGSRTPNDKSSSIEAYERALNLLSDPVLPVRAHGLILLGDLIRAPDFEPALISPIIEVFMRNIVDDESFIYLNAIKGLANVVDKLGKDIFVHLMSSYQAAVTLLRGGQVQEGSPELEKALRLGEALDMIVKRTGKAFSAYSESIVPCLMAIVSDASLPTIIRSSSLSILATCTQADHLALLPWSADLITAVLDLIQVESVASATTRPVIKPALEKAPQSRKKVTLLDDDELDEGDISERQEQPVPRVIDNTPTKTDGKHPALRRAAVTFLGSHIASRIDAAAELSEREYAIEPSLNLSIPTQVSVKPQPAIKLELPLDLLRRVEVILQYAGATDVDETFRQQAEEVAELVRTLMISEVTGVAADLNELRLS